MMLDFFNAYLNGSGEVTPKRSVTYYTMGEGKWKTTTQWPPAGFTNQRWYLSSGKQLSPITPTGTDGADAYKVDFSTSTGSSNRWMQFVEARYPDRRAEDTKLLTYTSPPLTDDVEITGSPVVTLDVGSTHTDGAFHVYFEDVAPDGRVTYISEGILRALHRKVSDQKPPYTQLSPYHSYKRADGEALVPGEITKLEIPIYSTSVLLKKGHALRIAIAGADASMFTRYPATGDPTISVYHSSANSSYIDIPWRIRSI